MSANILRLLEFDKVRGILAAYAVTPAGKRKAESLAPADAEAEMRLALQETAEMAGALAERFTLPLGPLEDAAPLARRARAASAPLEPVLFCRIADCLEAVQRIGNTLRRLGRDYPALAAIGHAMPESPELAERIRATVDTAGQVLDSASAELKALRRRIKSLRRRIEQVLRRMVEHPDVRPHLQYSQPTIYRERYVLPVNAYRKQEVRGIVHGTSDSGATLYIEPMAIVETGNDLATALGEADEEVRRILWQLTKAVADEADSVIAAAERLAEVDLLRAKGLMSNAFGMCCPRIPPSGALELRGARHPLLLHLTRPEDVSAPNEDQLQPEAVVPLDLRLADEFRMLMITGPNTGGKTVALKTIGLLALMARAGMNVPAELAVIPVYDAVYADIGDEQSLEQSLSTFSSHMSRIVRILSDATRGSLVLLDELGAGTDPAEGGALGDAILRALMRTGCSAVVVTHLGRLKTFATANPGVENASMDFDVTTLQPTYHLTMGTVGGSKALEIAERLGLPPALLAQARQVLDAESAGQYSSILDEVELARQDAEKRRDRMQYLEEQAAKLKEQYEEALVRLKAQEEKRGADMGLKLRDELRRLHAEAEELCAGLRHSHKSAAKRMRVVRDGLARCLERLSSLLEGHEPDRPLGPGDEVYVVRLHKWGTVEHVARDGSQVRVRVGDRQVEVDADDVQPWGHDV